MFDRYLTRTSSLIPVSPHFLAQKTLHYIIHRRHHRKKGIKRKLFQMTNAETSDVLAGAEFASVTSSVLKVSNPRGLVCEVDVKGSAGPFVMRLGVDPTLVLTRGRDGSVAAEFARFEGMAPPYERLLCPPMPADEMVAAFGTRRAVTSVKNCRLCEGSVEIVAVRKVQRNRLEIDARWNVSFLSCFVIGLFMFLSKP
jgi:hypothetical protein